MDISLLSVNDQMNVLYFSLPGSRWLPYLKKWQILKGDILIRYVYFSQIYCFLLLSKWYTCLNWLQRFTIGSSNINVASYCGVPTHQRRLLHGSYSNRIYRIWCCSTGKCSEHQSLSGLFSFFVIGLIPLSPAKNWPLNENIIISLIWT